MRLAATALFLLLLAACAGRPGVAPEPSVAATPVPSGVTGIYELQSVNDQGLPVLTGAWDDCQEHVVAAAIALYPDRRYVLSGTTRQSCVGEPPVESRGGGVEGRYSVEGDIVRFADAATRIEGAAGPGWVEDHPGDRLALDKLGGTGIVDGDMLTIRLEGGGIATFRKAQG